MIEREPITVILSAKGWVRAMKGHGDLGSADALKFKEGDGPAFAFHAQTTDKLLLATDNGRFRTEEHTSELQSLMSISYAVFCLKQQNTSNNTDPVQNNLTQVVRTS